MWHLETKISKIFSKNLVEKERNLVMNYKQVNLVTCKRCGAHGIFELNEPTPRGWLEVDKVGELCPDCADQYRRFMCNFMLDVEGYQIPDEWRVELPIYSFNGEV